MTCYLKIYLGHFCEPDFPYAQLNGIVPQLFQRAIYSAEYLRNDTLLAIAGCALDKSVRQSCQRIDTSDTSVISACGPEEALWASSDSTTISLVSVGIFFGSIFIACGICCFICIIICGFVGIEYSQGTNTLKDICGLFTKKKEEKKKNRKKKKRKKKKKKKKQDVELSETKVELKTNVKVEDDEVNEKKDENDIDKKENHLEEQKSDEEETKSEKKDDNVEEHKGEKEEKLNGEIVLQMSEVDKTDFEEI